MNQNEYSQEINLNFKWENNKLVREILTNKKSHKFPDRLK
jgi:hypothetical protein